MNKDNAKDYLPLVQALAEGKVIQHHSCIDGDWRDLHMCKEIAFTGDVTRWRIKPEPRKAWVWWPPVGSPFIPGIAHREQDAARWLNADGGHITEVTE